MNLLYLSAAEGGWNTYARILGRALIAAGHRVSILYIHTAGETISNSEPLDGIHFYHAKTGNWHYLLHRTMLGLSSFPRVIFSLEYAQALARMIDFIDRKERLDLIEIPEIFATPHLLNCIPYIVRLHASEWTLRNQLNERMPIADFLEPKMEGYAVRRASGISSPSTFHAEHIRSSYNLDRPIEIIPCPVDTQQFKPAGKPASPPVVLFVGRVEKRKGAHVLMQAMPLVWSKYPNCEFVFIGRINKDVENQVNTTPKHVRFLGALPHEKVVGWYQRATIIAAPSLWDNSPNVIYEAMSCGIPAIASRVGGIPEVVEQERTGLLVPPGDKEALAEAILSLLSDETRRQRMSANVRERAVLNFDAGKVASRTIAFYERVLGQKRNGRFEDEVFMAEPGIESFYEDPLVSKVGRES